MAKNKVQYGLAAEKLAAEYLRLAGLDIQETNIRTGRGEIDLVARLGRLWVFVEVRSRWSDDGISPIDSIGADKRRRVRRAVEDYLECTGLGPDADIRIDVVAITLGPGSALIEHLEDAL
ncbi:MAG: YraN family protein [Bradymonadales bacterium]|nr:YraN family protein [Bradymonadales bacterium]